MTLAERIRLSLTDELRRPQYRGDPNPVRGHCYVASEAAYHLVGGKASGYVPCQIWHEGDSHWFLRGPDDIIDPTSDQFVTPVPYHSGIGKGFLTRQPSRRAQIVMSRVRGMS
jgi:hypothetical protein